MTLRILHFSGKLIISKTGIFVGFIKWLQSLTVKHGAFDEVFDSKDDVFFASEGFNFKIKPLKIGVSVSIRPHIELIF